MSAFCSFLNISCDSLTVTVSGSGTVTDNLSQVSCSPLCFGTYPAGTMATLTATSWHRIHVHGMVGCERMPWNSPVRTHHEQRAVRDRYILRRDFLYPDGDGLRVGVGDQLAGGDRVPGDVVQRVVCSLDRRHPDREPHLA